jgi:hypothetical protein
VKSAHLNALIIESTVYLDGAVDSHSSHVTEPWTEWLAVWAHDSEMVIYQVCMNTGQRTVIEFNLSFLARTSHWESTHIKVQENRTTPISEEELI